MLDAPTDAIRAAEAQDHVQLLFLVINVRLQWIRVLEDFFILFRVWFRSVVVMHCMDVPLLFLNEVMGQFEFLENDFLLLDRVFHGLQASGFGTDLRTTTIITMMSCSEQSATGAMRG